MSRFANKVVLATGGSSGIGLAAAQHFAREGAKVVVTGRSPAALERAAPTIGPGVLTVVADVSKMSDLDALAETVRDRHGRVDVLYANAGVAKLGPVADMDEADFDEIAGINFKGAYFTVQKILPLLSDGGAVVFTTSWFTEAGVPGASVVSASKAALRSFTRTLAAELAARNIRVNAVRPGVIETPLFGKLGLSEDAAQELGTALLKSIPLKRFGRAEEVAKAVAFLASDDASYITGVDLAVDGGRTHL